jgi:hypothetical protein
MSDPAEIVVLREQVSERDVIAFVTEQGLELIDDTTRGYDVLATKAWATPDHTQLVHIEDHTADVRWVQTSGPDRMRLVTALRERLPYYDPVELLSAAQAEESPTACIRIISRLVPYRPGDCDPRFLAAWKRMLAHENKAVRRAAIRTAYGCPWPELCELVEQRLEVDEALGTQLRQLLRHLEDGARDPG